jgi:hypothetical protein
MVRTFRGTAALAVLVLIGCAERSSILDTPAPAEVVAAASPGASAWAPGFHFLPPLVSGPVRATGAFDPGADPAVEICQWSGAGCVEGGYSASFTGASRPAVTVDARDENYKLHWVTRGLNLPAGELFRVRVLRSGTELGHIDVQVVGRGNEARQVPAGRVVLLKDTPLMIKFRIEVGTGSGGESGLELHIAPARSAISPSTGLSWGAGAVAVGAAPTGPQAAEVVRVTFVAVDEAADAAVAMRVDDDPTDGFSVTFPASAGANTLHGLVTERLVFRAYAELGDGSPFAGGAAFSSTELRYDDVPPAEGTVPSWSHVWVSATADLADGFSGQADQGIGGVSLAFFYSADTALGADAIVQEGSLFPADRASIESHGSAAYVLGVRICDALENCRSARVGTFGVDVTPPTLVLLASSPPANAINPSTPYAFEVHDARSGVPPAPLLVNLSRLSPGIPATDGCVIGNWQPFDGGCVPVPASGPFSIPAALEGYYQLTVRARDLAGNLGTLVVRHALRDNSPPGVPSVVLPTAPVGGEPATFTGVAGDNLDLQRSSFRLRFGSLELPFGPDEVLGSFGSPLTTSAPLAATVPFVRAVEHATGGSPDGSFTLASAARFRVWDVAGHAGMGEAGFLAGAVTRPPGAISSFSNLGVAGFQMAATATVVPQIGVTTLRANVTGPSGTFTPPFSRVVVYRVVDGSPRFLEELTGFSIIDDGSVRSFTYFGPTLSGSAFSPGTSLSFFAVGFTAQGDALVSEPQVIQIVH